MTSTKFRQSEISIKKKKIDKTLANPSRSHCLVQCTQRKHIIWTTDSPLRVQS